MAALHGQDRYDEMMQRAIKYHGGVQDPSWHFVNGQLVDADGNLVSLGAPFSAPGNGFGSQLLHALPYFGAAVGMGALGGLGAGGGAALGPSTASSMAATQAALGAGAPASLAAGGGSMAGAAGGGFMGWLKKLDPTGLLLGGLSMFGGDDDQMTSFRNPGSSEDPVQSLKYALDGISRLGQGISERAPVNLRSSYVQKGPAPVQIPGIPFQIGGGLGTDPALADPSLLVAPDRGGTQFDPFQSTIPQKQPGFQAQPVKRRAPGGSNG